MMVLLAAGIVAVFRAPYGWTFRILISGFGLLGIYFGWLLLSISTLFGVPRPLGNSPIQDNDAQLKFQHPLVRRALWVLFAAGALLLATIVLGVTGLVH